MSKASFLKKSISNNQPSFLRRLITCLITLTVGFLMFAAIPSLPRPGNPLAPAFLHVSSRYMERGIQETGIPNRVVAVLMDYRSFDFFLFSLLLLVAGLLGVLIVFGNGKEESLSIHGSLILLGVGTLLCLGVGLACVFYGSNFLDYESLPLPLTPVWIRMGGALLTGLGVFLDAIAVWRIFKKE